MIRVADGAQLWVEDVMVERERIRNLERELANRVSSRLYSGGCEEQKRIPRLGSPDGPG
jgi:hypothetical protein